MSLSDCAVSGNPVDGAGEDTFELRCGGWWEGCADIFEGFDSARAEAESAGNYHPLELAGLGVFFHASGKNQGGTYFAWWLHWGDIHVFLRREEVSRDNMGNVKVEIGSSSLIEAGCIEGVWESVSSWLGALGYHIEWVKPVRVDICVDLVGVDIHEFTELVRSGHSISRVRDSWTYYAKASQEWTGFKCGKLVHLRVYDKVRELRASGDLRKLRAMVEKRWRGVPEQGVRIEFQMRREMLRERGIDSLSDYYECRAGLVAYLWGEWFRLASKVVDRVHTERCVDHAWWRRARECVEAWAGEVKRACGRVVLRSGDPGRLFNQGFGCIRSAFLGARTEWAVTGEIPSEAEFLAWVAAEFRRTFEDGSRKTYEDLMVRSQLAYLARLPGVDGVAILGEGRFGYGERSSIGANGFACSGGSA